MLEARTMWDRLLGKSRRSMAKVELDSDGFLLPKEGIAAAWRDVTEVVAWKFDAITTDTLCFDVKVSGPRDVVSVTEDFEGFWLFAKECEVRLPGFRQNWQEQVLKPAFAESRQVLFTHNLTAQ